VTELFVTNFNRNFTGVSATCANVLRQQVKSYDLQLVGQALPHCPTPISIAEARRRSPSALPKRPFAIWHVRRNTEMRAAIWARDVMRLPIRTVFTSAAQRRHSAFPRWLISRMDAIVATTEAAASFVPNVRAVVPHGVDTALFSPAEDPARSWTALGYGGTLGIATIGRIRPEKGTDLFVDSMLRLLPRLPGATALVLGKATREHQAFLDAQKAKITTAGLADRILFPGEVKAAELPALVRSLSMIVQLPRYEGYGMAPLEGMASGVPFVGSRTGYYQSFACQGKTGEIVPLEAAEQAAEIAHSILTDDQRHRQMCRDAREVAVSSFSSASEAEGYSRVYEELWAQGT